MKTKHLWLLILALTGTACHPENIRLATGVSETLYLRNDGASMRVLIEGNTASKTFLLWVHGGPGTSSFFYNTDYISKHLEDQFAVVYVDQRNAGSSQGNINKDHLHLEQMTEDLLQTVQLIKGRYGAESSIFIIGHSFGGLLSASFMTQYQTEVNGWIVTGGSHNYPLNNILSRDMLIEIGAAELAAARNEAAWEEIVSFCLGLDDQISHAQADQLNGYAYDAEGLIDGIEPFDEVQALRRYAIQDKWAIASTFMNHRYASQALFNEQLATMEFSSTLAQVSLPTLLLYGAFDFICPSTLGQDIYDRIGSPEKTLSISENCGHSPMLQDPAWFYQQIKTFMEAHR